jgi:hypothetical protein
MVVANLRHSYVQNHAVANLGHVAFASPYTLNTAVLPLLPCECRVVLRAARAGGLERGCKEHRIGLKDVHDGLGGFGVWSLRFLVLILVVVLALSLIPALAERDWVSVIVAGLAIGVLAIWFKRLKRRS